MHPTIRKTSAAVAAVGALGLGGAAIAGAADKSGSTTQTRPQREALSAATAAKVKAAALDKVPGATVLRTEAGGPYGTAYHAHIKTSDGTLKVVLVDKDFKATEVQAQPQVNVAFADGRVFNAFTNGPIEDPTGSDGKARVLGAGPLSVAPTGLPINKILDKLGGIAPRIWSFWPNMIMAARR